MPRIADILPIFMLLAALAPSTVLADGRMGLFEDLDTDRDGHLSSADLISAGQAQFGVLDADDDGTISVADLEQAWGSASARELAGQFIIQRDINGDGVLDMGEYINIAYLESLAAHMDENGNGVVSRLEFMRATAASR